MKKLIAPCLMLAALVSLSGCAAPTETSSTTSTQQTTQPGPITTTHTETTKTK